MKLAFIGLGLMGHHMARHLLAAGHTLTVHDARRAAAAPLVAEGALCAADPAASALGAELVFTCLPGPEEVEAVATGPRGLLQSMQPGSSWLDFSTSSPELVRSLHARFHARSIHMLDAPISGGPRGAATRKLVFWVGGDQAVYERYLPILQTMGDQPMWVGGIGCGAVTKLAHNLANFTTQAVLAEAFTLGVKGGVDPLVLFSALRQGTAGRSRTFDRLAEQFLPGAYHPPDFALKLALKDMKLAAALAGSVGVPLRMAQLAAEDMAEGVDRGWGALDARIALSLQEERAHVCVRVSREALQGVLSPAPRAPNTASR